MLINSIRLPFYCSPRPADVVTSKLGPSSHVAPLKPILVRALLI
jgi:hypothetical protein